MKVEQYADHLAFQMENGETVFELGQKVLSKQQIPHTVPILGLQYNLKDRLLVPTENLRSVQSCYETLSMNEKIQAFFAVLNVLRDVKNNGFIPLEAVLIQTEYIFWDTEKKEARLIVLPLASEADTGDIRSWNKRMMDTLHELTGQIEDGRVEQLMAAFQKEGKWNAQVEALLDTMQENTVLTQEGQNEYRKQERPMTLWLVHQGVYGQFALEVQKNEYIIGKKRDCVDGFLGMSAAVSRMHCKILRRGGQFFLTDLGSSNHTYVNSTMVSPNEEKELMDGGRVRIADIDFTVRIGYAD